LYQSFNLVSPTPDISLINVQVSPKFCFNSFNPCLASSHVVGLLLHILTVVSKYNVTSFDLTLVYILLVVLLILSLYPG